MKKVIIAVLFTCIGLVASDGVVAKKSGSFLPVNGEKLYNQHCALCHGDKATNSPKGVASLAGRDAVELALKIRSYRDQDQDVGAYTMHKDSKAMKDSTENLSRREIVALAKYISSIK